VVQSFSYVFRRTKEKIKLQQDLAQYEKEFGEAYFLLIGDHGGGSFKLLLQDLTRKKPNSPFSGFLVGEMDAPESYDNLKKAFGHVQVSSFCSNHIIKNKK